MLAKKNQMPHTTSRKGMARLCEELRAEKKARNEDPKEVDRVAIWIAGHKRKDGEPVNQTVREKIQEMKAIPKNQSNAISDDAVAQVLGKEHRGRVRGLGYGVTPTKVNATVITNYTTRQLQERVKNLEQLVMTLVNNNIQSNDGAGFEGRVQYSSTQPSIPSRQQGSNNGVEQSSSKSTSEQDASFLNGKKCKLLHWIGSGEVVAEAETDCTDSTAVVHHMFLCPDHWRVAVSKILVSKVPLICPTNDLQILEDSIGTYIAWPKKYITY